MEIAPFTGPFFTVDFKWKQSIEDQIWESKSRKPNTVNIGNQIRSIFYNALKINAPNNMKQREYEFFKFQGPFYIQCSYRANVQPGVLHATRFTPCDRLLSNACNRRSWSDVIFDDICCDKRTSCELIAEP